VDVVWDLRKTLPFADSTFARVYGSHVLEHFRYTDLKRLLADVYRVLRPGGELLIAVPDASLYVDAYVKRLDTTHLQRYAPAVISSQPMDALNYMFYMDGHHRFMFDEENLTFHCRQAGFVDCRRRPFESGLDLESRDHESLYLRCRKPADQR
jgi:predicted SAM-dependent methyltransferase